MENAPADLPAGAFFDRKIYSSARDRLPTGESGCREIIPPLRLATVNAWTPGCPDRCALEPLIPPEHELDIERCRKFALVTKLAGELVAKIQLLAIAADGKILALVPGGAYYSVHAACANTTVDVVPVLARNFHR